MLLFSLRLVRESQGLSVFAGDILYNILHRIKKLVTSIER